MGIQFPNFLSAQTHAPDYSGIGDAVENFYKGYNMPKDALIKEIQAKFAQPNAEADLSSTQLKNTYQGILNKYAPQEKEQSLATGRLTNRKSQLDLDTALLEYQQQQELQKQFARALANAGVAPGGSAPPAPMAPPSAPAPNAMPSLPNAPMMPPAQQGRSPLPGMPNGLPMPPATPGMTMVGSPPPGLPPAPMQNGAPVAAIPSAAGQSAAPMNAPNPAGAEQPSLPPAKPEAPNEVVITKGSPQLAGIDAMYDSNPLSRSFLEKKGYKKTQEVKFDNKTGRTTIITKYPSGKVTVTASAAPPPVGDTGIPLTNKMISQHQQMISAIDNAKPIIQDIIDQKGFQPYPRGLGMGLVPGFIGKGATYDTLVKSAVDTLMKAYGMANTDKGIGTVESQLLIKHGETISDYRNRLRMVLKDLDRRKAYSSNEVKRSNKISTVDSSAGGASDQDNYSSTEWEEVNGQ